MDCRLSRILDTETRKDMHLCREPTCRPDMHYAGNRLTDQGPSRVCQCMSLLPGLNLAAGERVRRANQIPMASLVASGNRIAPCTVRAGCAMHVLFSSLEGDTTADSRAAGAAAGLVVADTAVRPGILCG